jgi:hypothetical protein
MAVARTLWQRGGMEAAQKRQRLIPAWKLAGGIFLHFTVPAYLLTLAVAGISAALHGRSFAAMLGRIVPLSGWFLLGYALLGVVSVAALAIGEHLIGRWRRRHEAPLPPQARISAARLERALEDTRRVFGDAAAPALQAFTSPADHADPRVQALTADFAELVDRSATALASAPPDRREAIAAVGLESIRHIATSFEALATERSRLDEGDVEVMARYVKARYLPSDFSGER